MKKMLLILSYIILSNNSLFGQDQIYKAISDSEFKLYRDIVSTLKDTSFIVYPLIEKHISSSMLDIPELIQKYGFNREQFRKSAIDDVFIIKNNSSFNAINPDSIDSYQNYKEANDTLIFEPFLYAIKKHYHKSAVCYFNKLLLSKNKKFAIAEYFISCGNLCGYGATVLMKKKKDKWIIIKYLTHSIS
ncbi:hypothetical protein SAMN05444405_103162 [Bacteroides luti]|uniref:Uncharacterized protein n=1 Tax=Bacteroides luti TaxID=1297750 RepID=A0A1M4WSK0_9BACE|nr:hypothetical protein [Bacteroides luti]SHE84271.1 hypothetical protein SAMN05444405_103162 [Bacteroides luti]